MVDVERATRLLGKIDELLARDNLASHVSEKTTDFKALAQRMIKASDFQRQQFKACQANCVDGKVQVEVDGEMVAIPCHLRTDFCEFGAKEYEKATEKAVLRLTQCVPTIFHTMLQGTDVNKTEMLSKVERWKPSEKTFLVLFGNPGNGKSFAAAWALRQLALKAEAAKTERLECKWQSSYWTAISDDGFKNAKYGKVPMVIDDIGDELGTPAQRRRIKDVLDSRYEGRVPTVLTVGYAVSKLRDLYGSQTYNRINYSGLMVWGGATPLRSGWEV